MLNFFVGGEKHPFIKKVIKDKSLDNIVFYKFYIAGLVVLVKCSKSNIQGAEYLLNPNEPARIYLGNFYDSGHFQEVCVNLKNHENSKHRSSHCESGKKKPPKK